MKRNLALSRETVRELSPEDLDARGGHLAGSLGCPQTTNQTELTNCYCRTDLPCVRTAICA
ncbi:MAG TPA: hypothetical protein VG245_02120 [Candidatus Dormibacteraeota bacterium]|jgi:hypothetical protein|nr:hypothetical protein [Candidatus Dormibacteraeota bacterium]